MSDRPYTSYILACKRGQYYSMNTFYKLCHSSTFSGVLQTKWPLLNRKPDVKHVPHKQNCAQWSENVKCDMALRKRGGNKNDIA